MLALLLLRKRSTTVRTNKNYWLSCIIIDKEAMCKQIRQEKEFTYISEKGKSCPEEIREKLASYNVESRPIWKPMHMQPIYEDKAFVAIGENDVGADIFNRVNTSANKLKSSEIRKGAYQGDFYNFIIDCSKSELFRKVCPIPDSKAKRGEYEELALRFFAYTNSYLEFKHDVAPFLDEFLMSKNNGFDK